MSTDFKVEGPFELDVAQDKGGRAITPDNIDNFWKKNKKLSAKKGCYVFGMRAAKGFTPAYVGKATKSFLQEALTNDKISKYQRFLIGYAKGTPVMFFVVAPIKKGATNKNHIAELEHFLIQTGMKANPELLNVKGTKEDGWGVIGVVRGKQGKPSTSTTNFRRMMKL